MSDSTLPGRLDAVVFPSALSNTNGHPRISGSAPHPYSFLDATLRIGIVSPPPNCDRFVGLLQRAPLFDIKKLPDYNLIASDHVQGMHLILVNEPVHCTPTAHDTCRIRVLCKSVPVILVTGSTSPVLGATCTKFGVREVFEETFSGDLLLETVFVLALKHLLLPTTITDQFLTESADALFSSFPESVEKWALGLAVDPSYLRRKWRSLGRHTKHVLYLFRTYQAAFQFSVKGNADALRSAESAQEFFLLNRRHLTQSFLNS